MRTVVELLTEVLMRHVFSVIALLIGAAWVLEAQTAWRVTQLFDKPAGRVCLRNGQLYAVQSGSLYRLPRWGMMNVLHSVHVWDGQQWNPIGLPQYGYPADTLDQPIFSHYSFWAPIETDHEGNIYVAGRTIRDAESRVAESRVMVFRVAEQQWHTYRYVPSPLTPFEDSLRMTRKFLWFGVDGSGRVYVTADSYLFSWIDTLNNSVRITQRFTELFRVGRSGLELISRWTLFGDNAEEATPFVPDGQGGLYFCTGVVLVHVAADGTIEHRRFTFTPPIDFDRSARILTRGADGQLYLLAYIGTGRMTVARLDLQQNALTYLPPVFKLYNTVEDPNMMITLRGIGLGLWTNGTRALVSKGGFDVFEFTFGDTATSSVRTLSLGGPTNFHEVYWLDSNRCLVGCSHGLFAIERTVVSVEDEPKESLTVAPHPVKRGEDALLLGTIPENCQLDIVDGLGRTVSTTAFNGGLPVVPTAGLSAGVYTLRLQGRGGDVRTVRLVVVD